MGSSCFLCAGESAERALGNIAFGRMVGKEELALFYCWCCSRPKVLQQTGAARSLMPSQSAFSFCFAGCASAWRERMGKLSPEKHTTKVQ